MSNEIQNTLVLLLGSAAFGSTAFVGLVKTRWLLELHRRYQARHPFLGKLNAMTSPPLEPLYVVSVRLAGLIALGATGITLVLLAASLTDLWRRSS